MKKIFLTAFGTLATLVILQTGCNNSGEQKASNVKPVVPQDTLKTYIEALKMETKAFTLIQPIYYDSALTRYNKCLQYLNQALADNNNKGMYLFENIFVEINQGMEAVYDSINQPENSIKCALQCVYWAKRVHDNTMQIKFDLHVADKLKTVASQTSGNDTAKKGTLLRQALLYSTAGVRAIDSLKNNDMDDVKYDGFHLTSKIYYLMGDKKQAQVCDKKYRDLYFRIFNKQPVNKD